jgi:hypothetical protein
MASFVGRVLGAATLNAATYEEVEADSGATGQAIAVVALSSLSVGLAWAIEWLITGLIGGLLGGMSMLVFVVGAVVAFISYSILAVAGWLMWVLVTWIVGTKFLPEPGTSSNLGEMTRTVGFAQAPGMLRFLSAIPILGYLFTLVIWIWMLAAFVVAVRAALDYQSVGRAVGVCAIGWAVNVLIVEAVGRGVLHFVIPWIAGMFA